MLRPVLRTTFRAAASHVTSHIPTTRRFLSTAPPTQKSRSWKSSALRWGIAGAGIYYYSTSPIFAEEPEYAAPLPSTSTESEHLPTVDEIAAQRQAQRKSLYESQPPTAPAAETQVKTVTADGEEVASGSPQALEEEADQQGAFNPETGEINWDCPCLGGMAHGPCGPEFKEAFSCFVYSKEEPKGVDCIDKFKNMQDCFRSHPDVYGSELEDDEEEAAEAPEAPEGTQAAPQTRHTGSEQPSLANADSPHGKGEKVAEQKADAPPDAQHKIQAKQERSQQARAQVERDHEPVNDSDGLVPRAWHDTTSENTKAK